MSLKHISTTTRISLRTLEALENNEIGKLPGGIFSRAFVRSYAHEVGLDPDETVREFVQYFPLDHVTAGSASANEGYVVSDEVAVRRRQQSSVLLALAIIIPLAALIVYLVFSSRRPASANEGGLEASAASASAAADTAGGTAAASPAAAGADAPAPASSGALSPAAGSTAGTALRAGAATGAPVSAATPIGASEPLRLSITPDGPCWVRVTSDGGVREQRLLQKGEVFTQDARDGFEILVGDAGTFRFAINNRPGRRLGEPGDVVVARISRTNLQNWLQAQPSR